MDKATLLSKLDWLDQLGIWFAVIAALGTAGLAYIAFAHCTSAQAVAATANQRAAEANQKAEEEKLARLKIEERLAPRQLTSDQQAELKNKLEPFAGLSATILCTSDGEPTAFGQTLAGVLLAAGWKPTVTIGSIGGRSLSGITVDVSDDRAGIMTPKAALATEATVALIASLRSLNLYVLDPARTHPMYSRNTTASGGWQVTDITIMIGSK